MKYIYPLHVHIYINTVITPEFDSAAYILHTEHHIDEVFHLKTTQYSFVI